MKSVRHASGCLWTLVLISYWKMPIIFSFDVHYSKICWKLQERYICRFVCLYRVYFDRCCPLFNNIVNFCLIFRKYFMKYFMKYFRSKNSWNFTSLLSAFSLGFVETVPSPRLGLLRGVFLAYRPVRVVMYNYVIFLPWNISGNISKIPRYWTTDNIDQTTNKQIGRYTVIVVFNRFYYKCTSKESIIGIFQ